MVMLQHSSAVAAHSPFSREAVEEFLPFECEREGLAGHFGRRIKREDGLCFIYWPCVSCLLALSVEIIGLSPILTRHWPGPPAWYY